MLLYNEEAIQMVKWSKEKECIVYGAHNMAVTCLRILDEQGELHKIGCILVTEGKSDENPDCIYGIPVQELRNASQVKQKKLIIATPDQFHMEIAGCLARYGCGNIACITEEFALKLNWDNTIMKYEELSNGRYYLEDDVYDRTYLNLYDKKCNRINGVRPYIKVFPVPMAGMPYNQETDDVIRDFEFMASYERALGEYRHISMVADPGGRLGGNLGERFHIFMVQSNLDRAAEKIGSLFLIPIQAGAASADKKRCAYLDSTGDNISEKNKTLAEMTAIYWIWKNAAKSKYKGICHYRRQFIISRQQLEMIEENGIDVVLATPRLVLPDVAGCFTYLTEEGDLDVLLGIIKKKYPQYYGDAVRFYSQQIFYPCNMMIAKQDVFDDYCDFVFNIMLEFDGIFSDKKRKKRNKFSAYWAETVTALYYAIHKDDLDIVTADFQLFGAKKDG